MNHTVYFLGGPADLTKRVLPGRPAGKFIRVPFFADPSATYHAPADQHLRIQSNAARYRLDAVALDLYVAVFAGIE